MVNSKSWSFSIAAQKKFVFTLCVVTWAAIFFISGTLFIRRRYDMANQLASKLSSSFQEQIDNLSYRVSEGKTSAKDLTHALHVKINLTLFGLDEKMSALAKQFAEKRENAVQALHALHGGLLNSEEEKPIQQPTTQPTPKNAPEPSGPIEMKSGANTEMCVDSMEQPVGTDVQLNSCHAQEGNQAWSHKESNRLIENKAFNMCLRAEDGNDGSPVKTAACDENDTQQKWNRVNLLLMLDNGAMSAGRCLDVDPATNKLVIKDCDSTKESQHWT